MAVSRGINLRMVRGDTCSRSLIIKCGGEVLYLTDSDTGRFFVFDRSGRVVISKTLTTDDQNEDGAIVLTLEPSDTEQLEGGDYGLEMELMLSDGTVITPMRGILRLHTDLITPEVRDS